jgi:hypothetical protein
VAGQLSKHWQGVMGVSAICSAPARCWQGELGVSTILANRPLVLQYSSDTEDVFGIRMYGGLRTFALPDHLFLKNQGQWPVRTHVEIDQSQGPNRTHFQCYK